MVRLKFIDFLLCYDGMGIVIIILYLCSRGVTLILLRERCYPNIAMSGDLDPWSN